VADKEESVDLLEWKHCKYHYKYHYLVHELFEKLGLFLQEKIRLCSWVQ